MEISPTQICCPWNIISVTTIKLRRRFWLFDIFCRFWVIHVCQICKLLWRHLLHFSKDCVSLEILVMEQFLTNASAYTANLYLLLQLWTDSTGVFLSEITAFLIVALINILWVDGMTEETRYWRVKNALTIYIEVTSLK